MFHRKAAKLYDLSKSNKRLSCFQRCFKYIKMAGSRCHSHSLKFYKAVLYTFIFSWLIHMTGNGQFLPVKLSPNLAKMLKSYHILQAKIWTYFQFAGIVEAEPPLKAFSQLGSLHD